MRITVVIYFGRISPVVGASRKRSERGGDDYSFNSCWRCDCIARRCFVSDWRYPRRSLQSGRVGLDDPRYQQQIHLGQVQES